MLLNQMNVDGVETENQDHLRQKMEKMMPWDIFLFRRLAINLTGSQLNNLIIGMKKEERKVEEKKEIEEENKLLQ